MKHYFISHIHLSPNVKTVWPIFSGLYDQQTQSKPMLQTLNAIYQDAMSNRPSISPLFIYTDTICHTFLLCQDAMSHRLSKSPLYGRYIDSDHPKMGLLYSM